jgi:hypothetical protein
MQDDLVRKAWDSVARVGHSCVFPKPIYYLENRKNEKKCWRWNFCISEGPHTNEIERSFESFFSLNLGSWQIQSEQGIIAEEPHTPHWSSLAYASKGNTPLPIKRSICHASEDIHFFYPSFSHLRFFFLFTLPRHTPILHNPDRTDSLTLLYYCSM